MTIPCKLDLSASQASKLRNGHPIQLKADQIGQGDEYELSESNVEKIVNALQKGKGCRIQLSAAEMEGAGFGKSLKKGFKKASNAVKSVKKVVKDVEHEYRDVKQTLKKNHVGRKIMKTGDMITKKLDQYAPLVEDIPVFGTAYKGLQAGAHAANASVKQGIVASGEIDRMGKSVSANDLKRVGREYAKSVRREVVNANPQIKAGLQALRDANKVADAIEGGLLPQDRKSQMQAQAVELRRQHLQGQGLGSIKKKITKAQKSVAKSRLAPKITSFVDHQFARPMRPHMSGGSLVYEDNIRFVRPGQTAYDPPKPDVIPKVSRSASGRRQKNSIMTGGSFKNGSGFTFGGGFDR